jgi:glycosyltransferase family protein
MSGSTIPWVEDEFYTVRTIVEREASISRYGDGEFRLCGHGAIYFQEKDPTLSKLLRVILQTEDPRLLVCIPRIWDRYDWPYTEHQKAFWDKYIEKDIITKHLRPGKQYWSMCITRADLARDTKCESFHQLLKSAWSGKRVIYVQGETSNKRIPNPETNEIFDNASEVVVEMGTAKNGFKDYDTTIEKIKRHPKENTVVYLALGPTATVMAWDLHTRFGYQALDMGHYYQFFAGRKKRRALEPVPPEKDKIENPPTPKD